MKIACISLGCPKNQVDLDVMVHILLSAGHETVADLAEADVILVNTCGFIESAKTEAIENILEACSYKQQNPDLKVIVTGCLAERYRSQIEEEIPEVDAVVGCASNKAIDTIVDRLFHGEDHLESYGAKKDFPLGGKRVIGTPAHYAYLKIAEGCNINKGCIAENAHINGSRLAVYYVFNRLFNLCRNSNGMCEVVCRAHRDIAYRNILFKLHHSANRLFKRTVAADAYDKVELSASFSDNFISVFIFSCIYRSNDEACLAEPLHHTLNITPCKLFARNGIYYKE